MRLGRYELLYQLAKGGMGEVFVARRKGPGDIEKRVVIKRIRRDLSGNPRFVEMFLREAKVSMTLSHKNIAAVFDFGRVEQELFLAMEHVHGRDLARALRAADKVGAELSPAAVAYIGIEVCRALDYAQRASNTGEPIIHRDLSPKNLLISFSGEVVVADFGLAIESSDQLSDGGVRGTPAYLSPEQARGESLDVRSDLFSLGLVLYEIAGGAPAYVGDSPEAIIERARAAEVPALGGDVPDALRAVIDKATHRDLEERYADPRAMQRALDEFLITARSGGAAQPGHEIAEWLGELFDENAEMPRGDLGDDAVAAVTFLDDGDEAVVRGARDLGSETLASIAETVGDSEIEPAIDEAPDEPRPAPSSRRWMPALGLIGAAGVIAVLAFTLWNRSPGDTRELDAGVALTSRDATVVDALAADAAATIDAGATIDAAVTDAAMATADAAPRVEVGSGWLRVQSRPWARVSVRGTSGCAETPCRIKLRVGKHTVRLINPITNAEASRGVTIRADETTDLSVVLPAPE